MAPTGTIVITGGNGSLGSRIALAIAKDYPGKYSLVLSARNLDHQTVLDASSALDAAGADYSWERLDLLSIESVKSFAAKVASRAGKDDGKVPKIHGLVNSAAINSNAVGKKSGDGFDPVYQTNVLSPFLLGTLLLGAMGGSGVIVNVASVLHSQGTVDYNWTPQTNSANSTLSLRGAFTKYGSSKLWLVMLGYALQRRLNEHSLAGIQVIASDPGGMSGESRLIEKLPPLLAAAKSVATVLGPLIRLVNKSAVNPPEVPAAAISALFKEDAKLGGKYFILDDEKKSNALSMDEAKQEVVWQRVVTDLEINLQELGL